MREAHAGLPGGTIQRHNSKVALLNGELALFRIEFRVINLIQELVFVDGNNLATLNAKSFMMPMLCPRTGSRGNWLTQM